MLLYNGTLRPVEKKRMYERDESRIRRLVKQLILLSPSHKYTTNLCGVRDCLYYVLCNGNFCRQLTCLFLSLSNHELYTVSDTIRNSHYKKFLQ